MKRRGFTLLELLVVLAVITVLAAILFAVVSEKREQERRRRGAGCQQNIRQIGLAIKQYLSDYDESFPIVTVGTGGTQPYGWADACEPYVKNTQLFQCPLDDSQPPTPPATTVDGTDPEYTDYFYNSRLAGKNEMEVKYIASTVMLGDAAPGNARQHSTGGGPKLTGAASLVNRNGLPVGAATRHFDGANYAFAADHVKWYRGSDANTCPKIMANASGATALTFSLR